MRLRFIGSRQGFHFVGLRRVIDAVRVVYADI